MFLTFLSHSLHTMQDGFKIKGIIDIAVKDAAGNIKATGHFENLIVNAGKAEVINLIGNVVSPTAFTYLATGSGSAAATSGDTALGTENLVGTGLGRAAATVTRTTTTFTNDTLQLTKTFTALSGVTVNEVGVFNASSAGTMLGRKVVGPYTLLATDQFVLSYSITIV